MQMGANEGKREGNGPERHIRDRVARNWQPSGYREDERLTNMEAWDNAV